MSTSRFPGSRAHDWTSQQRDRDNATNIVAVARLRIFVLLSMSFVIVYNVPPVVGMYTAISAWVFSVISALLFVGFIT